MKFDDGCMKVPLALAEALSRGDSLGYALERGLELSVFKGGH